MFGLITIIKRNQMITLKQPPWSSGYNNREYGKFTSTSYLEQLALIKRI